MSLSILSKIKKADPLAPEIIFPFAALGFLAISLLGARMYPYYTISPQTMLFCSLSIMVFIGGAIFARELELNENIPLALMVLISIPYLSENISYLALIVLALPVLYLVKKRSDKFAIPLLLSGILMFLFFLHANGIPLIEQSLRSGGYTAQWAFGLSLFLIGLNIRICKAGRKESLLLTLLGLSIFLLGGYRGALILIAASAMTTAYYRGFIEVKAVAGPLLFTFLLVILAGAQASDLELDPVDLLVNRAAFTSSIGDKIMSNPAVGMHLWLEKDPRFRIGELYVGYSKSINAGLFGFLWLTGGYLSLMLGMLMLGIAFGYLHKKRSNFPAAYSLGIAYLLLSIEAGLDMAFLLSLLALTYLSTDKQTGSMNRQE